MIFDPRPGTDHLRIYRPDVISGLPALFASCSGCQQTYRKAKGKDGDQKAADAVHKKIGGTWGFQMMRESLSEPIFSTTYLPHQTNSVIADAVCGLSLVLCRCAWPWPGCVVVAVVVAYLAFVSGRYVPGLPHLWCGAPISSGW